MKFEINDERSVSRQNLDRHFAPRRQFAFRPQADLLTMLKDAVKLLSVDAGLAQKQISEAIVFLEKRDMPPQSEAKEAFVRGGLLPWQIRRLQERIEKDLDGRLTTAQLAHNVKLSTGYFCHAFKRTFGVPPHAYISNARVKRAQEMMLTTADPLSQIAVACGLADQSHLSRLFRKIVGQNPDRWRRANKEGHKSVYASGGYENSDDTTVSIATASGHPSIQNLYAS
jgi:transcriptional regulator GlxA family with amidase domain